MRVLMLSTDSNILRAGTEAQRRMLDYGGIFDELHIIVYTKHNADDADNMPMMRIADNVFIYPTNTRFKLFYFRQVYRIAKQIISNWKLEIRNCAISAQDPFETGLVGWLLKRRFQLPLQIQIHTDIFNPYFWRESLKNKLRVLLAKFLLPKADGIRVVSERIKHSLISNFQFPISKITVLPIFIDVKKIQNKKSKIDLYQKYPNHDFIILMASRLTREKNIDMAIKVMPEVIKRHSRTLLVIVGDGIEKEKLELNAKRLTLNANVKFEPWTEDLISYYKTADLFLLTSNYEGYGRTVIEAMAAGLPVIMTDVGLAGEVLIDELDGLTVPVGRKDILVKAVIGLLENKDKRVDLVREAQKTVDSLILRAEYLRLYKEALLSLSCESQ